MSNRKFSFNVLNRVSAKERSFIARQMAVMLDAGLPLVQTVRSLSEQTKNQIVYDSLIELVNDLENGYRLSDAIKKHPKIFNHVFVSVVAAGESSGKLDVALNLLADELERDYAFRSRVIGAMLYPALIVVSMFIVGVIMVTRIVPALESVFIESGLDLPWTTQLVVTITNSIIHYWYIYIAAIAFLIFLLTRYLMTIEGQRVLNNLLFKTPVVGILIKDLEMARFTRILGIMMQAGVPIIQAIDSVALVMDSVIFREALKQIARNVERGAPISQTMMKYKDFPTTVTEMIAAGERTGKLEQVLGKLADFYEAETNQSTKNFASLIEPLVFIIVGLGVAFLVFSIIVPIYGLAGAIQ
ncbi:type II secretion system F family protein [Candidatus Berkelbacteria bacterium]|nr:type II secretion system F family protein [Candidatus Berkelbacteria bacterium]